MFDFSKLGDLSKLADQAKTVQAKQEKLQHKQIELLEKISSQLGEVLFLLKERS